MKIYHIPIFIPHEGCPHDCVFCNQRKITGLSTSMTPKMAEEQIRTFLEYLPKENRYVEVAFFGGSFTGLPLSLQEEFYRVADSFRPLIDGIRLSTRPDFINEEILALAKRWRVSMIELGAQSSDDTVLEKNRRGHRFSHTVDASKQIHDAGIGLGLQMMTGMYGSDEEKDVKTAIQLAKLNPDCVRVYPVLVLKDTALARLYQQEIYLPQSLEDAILRGAKVVSVFAEKQIPVIRIGLHIGEELREDGEVLAGPFHPALGELIQSRVYRNRMEEAWNKNPNPQKQFEVVVPQGDTSKAIGHKRCNAEYFEKTYGVTLIVKEA